MLGKPKFQEDLNEFVKEVNQRPTKTDDNVIQGRKCGDTIDSNIYIFHKELTEHYKHCCI
jgi:hypothetical protein